MKLKEAPSIHVSMNLSRVLGYILLYEELYNSNIIKQSHWQSIEILDKNGFENSIDMKITIIEWT